MRARGNAWVTESSIFLPEAVHSPCLLAAAATTPQPRQPFSADQWPRSVSASNRAATRAGCQSQGIPSFLKFAPTRSKPERRIRTSALPWKQSRLVKAELSVSTSLSSPDHRVVSEFPIEPNLSRWPAFSGRGDGVIPRLVLRFCDARRPFRARSPSDRSCRWPNVVSKTKVGKIDSPRRPRCGALRS